MNPAGDDEGFANICFLARSDDITQTQPERGKPRHTWVRQSLSLLMYVLYTLSLPRVAFGEMEICTPCDAVSRRMQGGESEGKVTG